MSVSRAKFLGSLGKSLPGMALGGGVGSAAQALVNKMAVMSGPMPRRVAETEKPAGVEFIKSGPGEGNRIALTFDDGPTPGVTERILDELQKRKLRATFFMIGRNIVAAPELAQRVLAEGHEIGNHTFTHPKLTALPDARVVEEIKKTQAAMGELLLYCPAQFRPPFGALRANQSGLLQKESLGIVTWSVDPSDWSQPGEEKIVEAILTGTKAGSIIVCHDLYRQTADCLGQILDGLLERGFEFATVSGLWAPSSG